MNLREGILNSLIDDGESIVQIEKSLEYASITFIREQILELIETLLYEDKIRIEWPPEYKGLKTLIREEIEDYWFELNPAGIEEWGKIDEP